MWGAAIGLLNVITGGIFGLKNRKADLLQDGIKLASQIKSEDAKAGVAAFQMAIAETQSESWLTRTYRPLIPFIYTMFFIAFAFGYVPQALLGPMPPVIAGMFDVMNTIVLVGYPARTIDKIAKQINLGKIANTFITELMSRRKR